MSNNNTHSVLFELQKNLEDLSSAKEQVDFFRKKSLEITDSISEVQRKYVEHLQIIKADYEVRVNILKNELADFLSKLEIENTRSFQDLVAKSDETISKGIYNFENISNKVLVSNDEKIEAINSLLKHYENVIEEGNSLIQTLRAIDFPSKLDAISSKSQLIIESVTGAKQALEIKLNETHHSIIEKANIAKDQLMVNNDNKIQLLVEKIKETSSYLKITLSNNLEEQSKKTFLAFDYLNFLVEKQTTQTTFRLEKQAKEIKILKKLLIVTLGFVIISIILNFVFK
jgi:hypothetical protein